MGEIKCICCGKDGSGEPLVMHGKCHVSSPTYVTLAPSTHPAVLAKLPAGKKLTIYCSECDKMIAPFIVTGEAHRLDPECHPGAEVWVMMHKQRDQNMVTINCAKCEKEFARLKLEGYAPKE